MTNDERKFFWDTLCALEGKDFASEYQSLVNTIIYPDYLYRFRAVTPKTLETLRTSTQLFSSAEYFDDPFDTLIHVNKGPIEEMINMFSNESTSHLVMNEILLTLKKIIPQDSEMQGVLNNIDIDSRVDEIQQYIKDKNNPSIHSQVIDIIYTLNSSIRKYIWALCFSEDWDNEVLWIKYANQHNGFVVEYDFTDIKKDNKKVAHTIPQESIICLPTYYSDVRYDAPALAQLIFFENHLRSLMPDEIFNAIRGHYPSCMWEIIKISLIKNLCHEYDKEWRLVCPKASDKGFTWQAKPSSIFLGLRLKGPERELTIHCAKQAGIKNIYEIFINNESRLDKRLI